MCLKIRSLPSIVWIIVAIVALIVFIAVIQGAFYGFTQIEGLGSIALLLAAWVVIRLFSEPRTPLKKEIISRVAPTAKPSRQGDLASNIVIAFGILTFAFTGFALDQPGNVIYNLPIQWLFCPAGTQLQRGADIRNPRPGTTVITQDFTCIDAEGQAQAEVPLLGAMVVRFVEYILLGYLLLWLSQLYTRFRMARQRSSEIAP